MAERRPQEAGILRFATDLHVHSITSDGEGHPFDVVMMAGIAGVRTLAIADHESVGAIHLGIDLDAAETDEPDAACSPHLFSTESKAAAIAEVRGVARAIGLGEAVGSDGHRLPDLRTRWAIER